jgi:hypothetical protein
MQNKLSKHVNIMEVLAFHNFEQHIILSGYPNRTARTIKHKN